jgi:OmcA/MtrC family decaheme c-type cytochrome
MKIRIVLSTALLLIQAWSLATAAENDKPKYNASQKEFYLNEADLAFVQPGLTIKIQSVAVNGNTVSVTFRITDDNGQGLDRLGLETPATVSTSWILARINPGDTQYSAYRTNSAGQPSTDAGGSYESLGGGVYKYTFGSQLPGGFPANATHTVGVYATRDLRTLAEQLGLFQLVKTGRYISNDTYNFIPAGGEVTVVRDVVRTEACNQCHDPLALHGGARQITQLCILCHQPQNVDPDTGNTVDFKVMIHKIHQGANLPSVQAGKPYQIIGFNNSVNDYSDVQWPQDTRNCTTCHQGGTQSDNYKTNPSRVACGSCHDDIDFSISSGGHPGGVQLDDSKCSICHAPDGVEFDFSVTGIHTIPEFSKQLPGLKLEILGVTNTSPGSKPTVTFKVTDAKGNPLDPSKLSQLAFVLAGPTTDYTFVSRAASSGNPSTENALTAAKPSGSNWTYTFSTAIPSDAKGTFAIGGQARQVYTLLGSLSFQSIPNVRDYAFNPVYYFSVDGSKLQERREVVNVTTQCNVCHKRLQLHGGSRQNTQLCVMCHNPKGTAGQDGQTINFRTMVHRIHTGEELENPYNIGNFSANEIAYPGDRKHCETCHLGPETGAGVARTYDLPLPSGLAFADNPLGFFSPWGPATSACLGCHDSEQAAAHAYLQTATFPNGKSAESCATCHGEGADFAVSRVHAR